MRYMQCGTQPASASTHTTLQLGVALEHAAEDERADDVLAAADDRQEAVDLRARGRAARRRAGEDVERQRQPEVDGRLARTRRTSGGRSPSTPRDRPASSRPRSPSALMRSRSAMPSSGVRIAVWPMPISRSGCARAVLGDPAVVGVEAGLLVVDVGVVAEHHADRRVDDLGGDAVAVLVGAAGPPGPSRRGAGPRSATPSTRDLLGRLAGGGDQAHRDRLASCPSMTNTSPRLGVVRRMCGARSRNVGSMWSM